MLIINAEFLKNSYRKFTFFHYYKETVANEQKHHEAVAYAHC